MRYRGLVRVVVAVACLAGCADVAERVDLALDARTQSILLIEDEPALPLRVIARARADLDETPLLLGNNVAVLEYEEPLSVLGLRAQELVAGTCRALPEALRVRSRAVGDGGWASPAVLSARVTAFRLGCEGCPNPEADGRGRCLPACAGRRLPDGTCDDKCGDGTPVDASGLCGNGCLPGFLRNSGGGCILPAACVGIGTDGSGVCHPAGDCFGIRGFHGSGDGRCLPLGECGAGFVDGGGGACVARGTCAPGYHDGGDGACVVAGACTSGRHDGGDGLCVATSTCSDDFGLDPKLGCLPFETCPPGEHDNGAGTCQPEGRCFLFHTLDADGVCFNWRRAAPMQIARFRFAAASNGGNDLIVAGGSNDASALLDTTEIYSAATDRWRFGANLPEGVTRMTSIGVPGGGLMIAGGLSSPRWTSISPRVMTIERDGRISATFGAPLMMVRLAPALERLGSGEVLLAGGFAGSRDPTLVTEILDPSTQLWRQSGDSTGPMLDPATVRVDRTHVFARMGNTRGSTVATAETQMFDAETGLWRSTAALLTPRVSATMVLLQSREVFVAGGDIGDALTDQKPTDSAEIYAVATDTWRRTTPMSAPRFGHAMVRLCDGRVLAVGGADANGAVDSAEIYDPRDASWSAAGRVPPARLRPAVIRRDDCQVVVLGGAEGLEVETPDKSQFVPVNARNEVWLYSSPGLKIRR